MFGKCYDINIANMNQPPSATTNHCKNTPCNPIPLPIVIHLPKHPTAARIITNHQITTNHSKNSHQNHHQRFKKLSPTTKKTTTNQPKNNHQKSISERQNHPQNQIKNLKRKPMNKQFNLKIQQPSKKNATTQKI